jgi:hemolysin D
MRLRDGQRLRDPRRPAGKRCLKAFLIIAPADSGLEVEAFVPNKDIGFVQPGQEAQIKVQTFNFTRHGPLGGQALDVSDDVVAQDRDREGRQRRSTRRASRSSTQSWRSTAAR